MKYLESYKSNKKYIPKLNSNIVDIRNKFASGKYIIFLYSNFNWVARKDVETLILGQIGNIEHILEPRSYSFQKPNESKYVGIKVIDFTSEMLQDNPKFELDQIQKYNIGNEKDFKDIIYTSNSLKETQEKFDELKEFYEVTWNAMKYNL